MKWRVDTPLRFDEVAVAAIVEFNVRVGYLGPVLTGTAKKRPLAILQLRNSGITVTDIAGKVLDADEVETLYPTAIEQFRALLHPST